MLGTQCIRILTKISIWELLEVLLGGLGCHFGAPGVLLGHLGCLFGALGGNGGPTGRHVGPDGGSESILGPFWESFGEHFQVMFGTFLHLILVSFSIQF